MRHKFILLTIIYLNLLISFLCNNSFASQYLITNSSVAEVKISMSLQEVKAAIGNKFTLKDVDRAEVPAIGIFDDDEELFQIWFFSTNGYLDCFQNLKTLSKAKFSKNCFVKHIEIYNPKFATKEGVHAQMFLSEAEEIYGKATLSGVSEIEAEEYANFKTLGKNIKFKLNYCTQNNISNNLCKINAISISRGN